MRALSLIYIAVLMRGALTHMPTTVHEFCSHVVGNAHERRATCDSSQCQGRPGKIGPVGPSGIQGLKGDKGDQGTSEGLEQRVENVEDVLCQMGVRSGIPDSSLSASSSVADNHGPHLGRLEHVGSPGIAGAWCAGRNRLGEMIQVDFGKTMDVAGVITQGRQDYPQWVTKFKAQCGSTVGTLATVTENGVEKVFVANGDQQTKVFNKFKQPLKCRYIRIYPQSWHGHVCMRMEFVHGFCYDFY